MGSRLTVSVMAFLVLTAANAQATIDMTDATLYYSFDNVGATVIDGSGNSYDGTVHNVVAAQGVIGGAASFEGAQVGPDGSVLLPAFIDVGGDRIDPAHIPTSAFTLAVWVNVKKTGISGYSGHQAIFNPRAGDDTWLLHPEIGDDEYRFAIRAYGMDGVGDDIGDMRYGAGDTNVPIFDAWHHIAMTYTYDAGSGTAEQAIYIDGELALAEAVDDPAEMAADWNNGARVGLNINDVRQFTGLMDELYIFNRTLSAEEIRTLATIPEPTSFIIWVLLGGLGVVMRRR